MNNLMCDVPNNPWCQDTVVAALKLEPWPGDP
jgi:hypothetical protein